MAEVIDWNTVRVREINQRFPALSSRHIGCPLAWFRRVFPVVRGKRELAVALYLYRLRSIRRTASVVVANEHLLIELGIDRYVKYRTLKRLAEAGIVRVTRHGRKALKVTLCEGRSRCRGGKTLCSSKRT